MTISIETYRPLAALMPDHWQSGTVQATDGTALHYTRTGKTDQPSIMLLHGVQVSGKTWLRTAQALEAQYELIMPDFRGHGESGRLDNGLSSDTLVNDTLAIMDAVGLEKPVVVGHSMGADVAGRVAAVRDVRGCVLVDPALQNFAAKMMPSDGSMPAWMQPILATMQALSQQSHAERMQSGLRLLPPGATPYQEADYVSFVEGNAQFDTRFYQYMATLGYLFEAPDVIAKIECPILLLTAPPMLPFADNSAGVAAFQNHWRHGEHIQIDGSGHAIMFDQFETFIGILQKFLDKQ